MTALFAMFAALFTAGGLSGGSDNGGSSSVSDSGAASGGGGGGSGSSGDSAATLAALSSPDTAFYAEDGQLVLEAESAEASGSWEARKVDGEDTMLWDHNRNNFNRVEDDQALSYEFVAEEAGRYYIAIHGGRVTSAMDPDDVRDDMGNDSFVRITNLETGEVILDPTKLFVGLGDADEELKWGDTFDINHDKSDARVQLEDDTAYRLDLIGRSDGHAIDRVTLAKGGFLRDTDVAESGLLMDALSSSASAMAAAPVEEDDEDDALLVA